MRGLLGPALIGILVAVTVGGIGLLLVASAINDGIPVQVQQTSPVPTPGPTPPPGIGFRSIAAFTTIPDPLDAALFPTRVDSGHQTVIAPGCGNNAPGTRLIYVYVYPQILGELTFFGQVFNDVNSLAPITGFTEDEVDYLAYETPLIICCLLYTSPSPRDS